MRGVAPVHAQSSDAAVCAYQARRHRCRVHPAEPGSPGTKTVLQHLAGGSQTLSAAELLSSVPCLPQGALLRPRAAVLVSWGNEHRKGLTGPVRP